MLLYDHPTAPSPRRVRIFLAEKGRDVPRQVVDLGAREQHGDAHRRRYPASTVPVLELDDGTCIGESMAICRYLEATWPDPPLLGNGPKEQGLIEMWNRRIEMELYLPVADALRNRSPRFEGRALAGFASGVEQIPALAKRGQVVLDRLLDHLAPRLAEPTAFVVGARFAMPDIWLLTTVDFAERVGVPLVQGRPWLQAWHERASARPSARA
ncbi:MAG: glutathione S-transferase family protein [Sandaracinaceae bacterium]